MAESDSQTQGAKFFSYEDLPTTFWVLEKTLNSTSLHIFSRLCDHGKKTQLIGAKIIDSENVI